MTMMVVIALECGSGGGGCCSDGDGYGNDSCGGCFNSGFGSGGGCGCDRFGRDTVAGGGGMALFFFVVVGMSLLVVGATVMMIMMVVMTVMRKRNKTKQNKAINKTHSQGRRQSLTIDDSH